MNDHADNPPAGENESPQGAGPADGPKAEPFQFDPVGARVTERVAEGTFSTGVIILDGPDEFVLDFIRGVAKPASVASRVVMSPRVVSQFLAALKSNLQKYEDSFGKPLELPRPNPHHKPSIREVYDGLKVSDENLSGAYANAVRIGHSPSEFCFDFITRFFPTASVSSRVYMTPPQVVRLVESLSSSYDNYLTKTGRKGPDSPGPGPKGPDSPPPNPPHDDLML